MHTVFTRGHADGAASGRHGSAFLDANNQRFVAQSGVNQTLGTEQFNRVHLHLPAGAAHVQMLGADAHGFAFAGTGRGFQQVHGRGADEAGDKGGRRAVVHLFGRAELLHHTTVHHDHALGQCHGLDLVVGDEQGGDAEFVVQLLDLEPGLCAQLGVQVGQRFVKQKHLGLAHDGAAHGHTLALAAGQLARLALEQVAQLQNLGGFVDTGLDVGQRHLGDLQAVGHVVEHRHVRVQRVVLEHHGDVAFGRLQVVDDAVANQDLATAHLFEPCHHPQEGGLAAARWADDDDEFTVGNGGVDAVDNLVGAWPFAVALDDVLESNRSHGVFAIKYIAACADVVCARGTFRLNFRLIFRCQPGL